MSPLLATAFYHKFYHIQTACECGPTYAGVSVFVPKVPTMANIQMCELTPKLLWLSNILNESELISTPSAPSDRVPDPLSQCARCRGWHTVQVCNDKSGICVIGRRRMLPEVPSYKYMHSSGATRNTALYHQLFVLRLHGEDNAKHSSEGGFDWNKTGNVPTPDSLVKKLQSHEVSSLLQNRPLFTRTVETRFWKHTRPKR
ncbi:hypothetical protein C8Q80DRAFT_127159 [Daedaleopsis nitida]|nr:hypothetical protein C8Q80DRAFT_127159 [Daedaleopsis nitida]